MASLLEEARAIKAGQQQPSPTQQPGSGSLIAEARAIRQQQSQQQPQQVQQQPQEESGFIQQAGQAILGAGQAIREFVTGEDRETRATRELPELGQGGLLAGEDQTKGAAITPALLTATNPSEVADILKSNFPNIGISQDEKGNLIAANNRTGTQVVINKPGFSKMDLMQGLGLAAAFTPAARATSALTTPAARVAGGALTSGATQAGIEAAQQIAGSKQELGGQIGDIALSAALGGAAELPAAVRASRQAGIPQAAPVEQVAKTEAQEIVEAGRETDIPVLTTDIAPPKGIVGGLARQLGERIPVLGTGGLRASQSSAREKAVIDLANSLPAVSDDQIVKSLAAKADRVKKAAGSRIESTINKMDDLGEVDTSNTLKAIDDSLAKLKQPGKITDDATIGELENIKQIITENPQSFRLLRSNRTSVRELAESADPLVRSQLPSFSKSQLNKVRQAMSKDLDKFVRQNEGKKGLARYKEDDLIYSQEARKLTKSRLKNVLDRGEITPEAAETMLFSRKPSEVKLLHSKLTKEGKTAARSALIMRSIEKAGGVENINPTRFANELTRLKKQTDIFFKGAEGERLEGLRKVLMATKRAQEAGVVTPTGQSIAAIAAGAGAGVAPLASLITATTVGGFSRAYESAVVRNLLARLGRVRQGSRQEKSILNKLVPVILAAQNGDSQTP
jgi:hypothetical protein